MNGFKKVVLFLKVTVCLLMKRTFGSVIHDTVLKYDNFKLYYFFSRHPGFNIGCSLHDMALGSKILTTGKKFSWQWKNCHDNKKKVKNSSNHIGGSRTAATSKMEHFLIIVNGWKPLTIIPKSSILDVAAVLDPPLNQYHHHLSSHMKQICFPYKQN